MDPAVTAVCFNYFQVWYNSPMAIHIALNHKTTYRYDRLVEMAPHIVRLRPAPHCRTPIHSYSLTIKPDNHFVNWQQDPHGNYLARLVFPEKAPFFDVEVDLVAEMTVINPFDFFLEPDAERYPFAYDDWLTNELAPFRVAEMLGPKLAEYLAGVDRTPQKTVDFLVELNRRLQTEIDYVIRMEPGVQSCEETLTRRSGSCRDSAWLLVQVLRHLGFATRFVSGYLIQLTADVKALDGPSGTEIDFTDLHAWTEAYLPGAGWVGLDPTSGLLAGEGHIPLACTPDPIGAAPITGAVGDCETEFEFSMTIERIREDPRVTKPYTDEQWEQIGQLGREIDQRLIDGDVRLTMGGEPTFVSIDDMEGDEWNIAAVGPTKLGLSNQLILKLKQRFGEAGLLHFGQGKWYPGEPLPRWALHCYWRRDGHPMWRDDSLFADASTDYGHTVEDAQRFSASLAQRMGVSTEYIINAYEDVLYYTWRERRLPVNVSTLDSKLDDKEERARLARVFEQGITSPVGCVLPLQFQWWQPEPIWKSGKWPVRSEEMFLIPGDSPMGFRLPLQSLTYTKPVDYPTDFFPYDSMAELGPLAPVEQLREGRNPSHASVQTHQMRYARDPVGSTVGPWGEGSNGMGYLGDSNGPNGGPWNGDHTSADDRPVSGGGEDDIVRTALCIEPRDGRLHIFMPPIDRLEHYLDLISAIEETASELSLPIVIEGYLPPHDPRINHVKVTPDPGVIEVNVHPAHSWDELVEITTGVYEDARQTRLGTEKFDLDGTHTGTGGGNHVVLGGPTPADSPFLRRPDVLRSLIGYWTNHPSLSYLFSCKFVGPTSQAPRVDEGRRDALYELQIAFEQIQHKQEVPPWIVDRTLRNLLVDVTGNTHRSEFCIDKLFSPDTSSGRLGLVEFRAFEMPPHARMSLTQQLLLRALVTRFWNEPYVEPLCDWDTTIHDRFLLPHFIRQDFGEVIEELQLAGYPLQEDWFDAHFEFRFPFIGRFATRGLQLELRQAIEPWYVLGEEPAGGAAARYVDSSLERLQVKVQGVTPERYIVSCNGRKVPLFPTGTQEEAVAGVRFRAWQPPSCLHPTIPTDEPLVFDIYDKWMKRSIGGCRYHVGNAGGLNPESAPVNANEAESRRASRFFAMGHTAGPMAEPVDEKNPAFPMTLDMRRNRNRNA